MKNQDYQSMHAVGRGDEKKTETKKEPSRTGHERKEEHGGRKEESNTKKNK